MNEKDCNTSYYCGPLITSKKFSLRMKPVQGGQSLEDHEEVELYFKLNCAPKLPYVLVRWNN